MEVSPVQFVNASFWIVATEFGMEMLCKCVHPSNAFIPMVVRDDETIVIDVSPIQPWNVPVLIPTILLGTTNDASFEQL